MAVGIGGRGHAAIEEWPKASGIKWVILSPGVFMQNVLDQAASIKTGRMLLLFAKDLPVALIDVRDTGAVGARILIDLASHAGKTYKFTGKLATYGAFAEVFFADARPANRLCRHHARAGRAGHESAQHAALLSGACPSPAPSSAWPFRPRKPS